MVPNRPSISHSMKRPSSPSLQLLAAVTSVESSAVMSSRRPAYRGIQYQIRRGVSDQSYSSSRGQFVTGDSQFQSVSDANRGFRPVEDAPNFHNQYWPCNPPPHFYPPPYSYPPPPPPFNTPPSSNPHLPPFNRGFRPPQQFWPRPPKPLDYRNWEYPKLRPPPHCERFKVLSYNILADYLANNHRSKLYFHIPPKMLEWEWRKRNIIFELGLWSADILCFQMRTGAPVDGCAIFWRVSSVADFHESSKSGKVGDCCMIDSEIHVRFKLLHEECIEFNKLGLRDNVAQICVLELLNQNNTKDMPALPSRVHIERVAQPTSGCRKKELKDGDAKVGLGYLSAKFVNDSLFVFNFTVDENSCLDTLFWTHGRSQMDYAAFGNVLGLTQRIEQMHTRSHLSLVWLSWWLLVVVWWQQSGWYGCSGSEDSGLVVVLGGNMGFGGRAFCGSGSLTGSNKVVICNIHVLYNPRRGEIKLGQIRVLLDRAHAVSKLWDDAPVVLSGDFNCTPKADSFSSLYQSPLYNYIAEQKLNLSDLPRDKLSGQASAEIRPPMQVSLGIRAQQADSRGGALLAVDPRELSQSGSPLVVQQQSRPERNSVNLPSINSLSQPQCVRTGLNLYASNPNSGRCGNEEVDGCKDETPDGGLRESLCSSQNNVGVFVEQMKKTHSENICSNSIGTELIKETRQNTLDGCNNVFHSLVSIGGLKDSAISPRNEGKVSGALRNDGYEFTSVDSCHEDLTEAEHEKQMQAPINAQFDSFIEQSKPILQTENRISNCEKSKLSSLSSNDNTDAITDPTPSGISSTEISSSSTVEVSATGSSESFSSLLDAKDKDNPSNFSKVNVSRELTSTDYMIGGKMENLPLEDLPETDDRDKVFDEDSTKFLSELYDGNESFPSNISHAVRSDLVESDESFKKTEPDNALNFRYDPSAWTPMEIETATGNADCTLVEHPLKLRSTYAEVEDCSGTRDSNGEPLVTSYNRRSEGLQTVGVLAPIPKHAMQWTPGFPTKGRVIVEDV
ncbi:hypothetical protein RHMOL_Rhmol07G0179100 [Rhododendron molle]|uniref:Uncharacterized protein n=1 Tax=Rhododendron molle TaxID=49168 RepID=A0ACC0N2K0_RHOML|nr:hypothetical protein RHMOL_Rhmol07G0179100 [Rhododendron molle]